MLLPYISEHPIVGAGTGPTKRRGGPLYVPILPWVYATAHPVS